MDQIFISYSRKDTDFVRRVADRLLESGIDIWVDWEDIPPSVDWIKEIQKGIESADIFLLFVSPDSMSSKVCKEEISHAALNGKRIIPVIVRDVDMKSVPPEITHLNWIFFSRPQDTFDEAFEKILAAIHTDYDWVQVHRRLQVRALEWERNQHEKSLLLHGKDLHDAEAQLTVNGAKDPKPTELQKEFVTTSRTEENIRIAAEQAKEQQLALEKKLGSRLRRLTYLMLAVFTVAFIALFFWLNTVTNNLALTAIKDQMLALVETSVCFIKAADFDSFVKYFPAADPAVYQDSYYETLKTFMDDVIMTNQNIKTDIVLYTITRGDQPDQIYLIAATGSMEDYKTSIPAAEVSNALVDGLTKTAADMNVIYDEHGAWVTACSPIHAPSGSVGALCADFSAKLLDDTRRRVTTTLGIAFLAIYPAMILLVVLSARSASNLLNKFEANKTPAIS